MLYNKDEFMGCVIFSTLFLMLLTLGSSRAFCFSTHADCRKITVSAQVDKCVQSEYKKVESLINKEIANIRKSVPGFF